MRGEEDEKEAGPIVPGPGQQLSFEGKQKEEKKEEKKDEMKKEDGYA